MPYYGKTVLALVLNGLWILGRMTINVVFSVYFVRYSHYSDHPTAFHSDSS